jgi:subtilisin family serine protease
MANQPNRSPISIFSLRQGDRPIFKSRPFNAQQPSGTYIEACNAINFDVVLSYTNTAGVQNDTSTFSFPVITPDADGDGVGDACNDAADVDGDEWADNLDNCPGIYNPDQSNGDSDEVGDLCDTDMDGDGVGNEQDVCPSIHNPEQTDTDGDGVGDACNDSPDAVFPNDPSFGQLWGLQNEGLNSEGVADADIDAPEAWSITTGSEEVVVAVIDTGVDPTHPDLAANMWVNDGEIAGNGVDDDGNGYIDDIHGINAITDSGDPMDDHYHGTHVAGTIAASGDNNVGVVGVSWRSKIMALKFLSASGSGHISDAIKCLNYAVKMKTEYGVNIKLTNNSWGGGGSSELFQQALNASAAADILFVAAAGNNGGNNDSIPSYPSSYDSDHVIAVAATDRYDNLAYFSQFGQTSVDLGAPGVDIHSTSPGSTYRTLSGTSMAAPHVSGVLALMASASPNATGLEHKQGLLSSVEPIASLAGKTLTGGRLNAALALGKTADPDGDQLIGANDNCSDIYNPYQVDSDQDGYGNACDGDFDQSGRVDGSDSEIFTACIISSSASELCIHVDTDGLGVVSHADFSAFAEQYKRGRPGPSNLENWDGDGYIDDFDNCRYAANPDQADADNDGIGDLCECNPGYVHGPNGCEDINECTENIANCDPNALCTNSVGSFSCACTAGWEGDGILCTDIDECATNNGGCGDAVFVTCTNNPKPGATPACTDIDECAVDNGGCGSPSAFTCTNNHAAPQSCADLDECAINNGGCGGGNTAVLHSEDFEVGLGEWVADGLWRHAQNRSASGTSSAAYNDPTTLNYDIGLNSGSLTSPTLSLVDTSQVVLDFNSWSQTESGSGFDRKEIQVSIDDGLTWSTVHQIIGNSATAELGPVSVDLSAYSGPPSGCVFTLIR